jgi:hypothetical protein
MRCFLISLLLLVAMGLVGCSSAGAIQTEQQAISQVQIRGIPHYFSDATPTGQWSAVINGDKSWDIRGEVRIKETIQYATGGKPAVVEDRYYISTWKLSPLKAETYTLALVSFNPPRPRPIGPSGPKVEWKQVK